MKGMTRVLRRDRPDGRDDSGVGLLLVIVLSVVIMTLVATAITIAVNALSQSRRRTDYELALAAAETGVDVALARQQDAFDNGVSNGYPIPSPSGAVLSGEIPCIGSAIPALSKSNEEAQARAELLELANTPGCLQTTDTGQYVVIRPTSTAYAGSIYAMGWAPNRAQAGAARIIKVDYIFVPYAPSHAILTGGDLEISGSVRVTVASGSTTTAGVHTNGALEYTTGSLVVCGDVSSSQGTPPDKTYGNECTGSEATPTHAPTVALPKVDATSFYRRARLVPTANDAITQNVWFDLCPAGTSFAVRYYSDTGEPCTGDPVPDNPGVEYTTSVAGGPTFEITVTAKDGVYFANGANLTTKQGGGKPSRPPRRTLIAAEVSDCDPSTGNIDYSHHDMQDGPWVRNLFMMADTDLRITANVELGHVDATPVGGMYVAGDDIELWTSSDKIVGAAAASNQCESGSNELVSSNMIQGLTFWYDGSGDSPFSSLVNVTLWLEY